MMLPGVRPTIVLASTPIASTLLLFFSMATTEGSLITMPRPRTLTRVLAVPRSMPMSNENRPRSQLSGLTTRFLLLIEFRKEYTTHQGKPQTATRQARIPEQ